MMSTDKGGATGGVPGNEPHGKAGRPATARGAEQGGGAEQCCDPHRHPHARWHKHFMHGRLLRGAGACCGPAPVTINVVMPEQFSCCPPDPACCADDDCCSEEATDCCSEDTPAAEK